MDGRETSYRIWNHRIEDFVTDSMHGCGTSVTQIYKLAGRQRKRDSGTWSRSKLGHRYPVSPSKGHADAQCKVGDANRNKL